MVQIGLLFQKIAKILVIAGNVASDPIYYDLHCLYRKFIGAL